ncbi:MAG: type I secretion C-terminal target domain-containing protein, partial [Gammaproteobacteria bacterium]
NVAQYATDNTGAGAVVVDGVTTIATALGGSVVVNADGSFTYTAPASLDHSNSGTLTDSFAYIASDGGLDSGWTTVNIDVPDAVPTANNDTDGVGYGGTVYSNVITVAGVSAGGANGAEGGCLSEITLESTPIPISESVSTHNDRVPNTGGVTSTSSATGGSVSGNGPVVFDPDSALQVLAESDFETVAQAQRITDRGEATAQNNSAATATDFSDRSMFSSNDGNLSGVNVNGYSAAYCGNIYAGGDQDWLEVTLAAGENIWLDADNAGLQVNASIYDANGNFVTTVNNNSGGPRGGYTATTAGRHYIVIEAQNAANSGNYDLLMTIDASNADYSVAAMGSFDYSLDNDDGVLDTSSAEIVGVSGNTLTGGDESEIRVAGNGDDIPIAGDGDDALIGGQGADDLQGGASDDLLGGAGIDIYALEAGDEGTLGTPAVDTINDFTVGVGGDVLDLSDMLQNEDLASLDDFLNFSYDSGSGNTTISIDTDGNSGAFETQQQILLTGVDLTANGTLSDQQILDNLLNNGNLVVDQ